METSILKTIRSGLGIDSTYTGFDEELVMAINTAIMGLTQLGIGPEGGLTVTGDTQTWTALFDSVPNIEAVKSYILLKSRLEFDPPGTSFLIGSYERQLQQIEFRLYVEVDPDPAA
jgi:hypothetical protein